MHTFLKHKNNHKIGSLSCKPGITQEIYLSLKSLPYYVNFMQVQILFEIFPVLCF